MTSIQPESDGFYHPDSEAQIRELVRHAAGNGLKVRVRGAGHSYDPAIYSSESAGGRRGGIDILLDRMRQVTFDDERKQVTVQAGCNLGIDPEDPSGVSTDDNSLFYQLDQHGWALPNTGGITHQTVGGFLSTGSSGGSLWHSIGDQIVKLRLIDGRGRIQELTEEDDPDGFFCAGVSVGLLGIITAVTFQCEDRYHIIGSESVRVVDEGDIDFFGPGGGGRTSLEDFLRSSEYSRLLWWPQRGVQRMVVWQARRMKPEDYNEETGTPGAFQPRPYQAFEEVLGSRRLTQKLASGIYHAIRHWNTGGAFGRLKRSVLNVVLPPVMNLFLDTDGEEGTQRFWDVWYRGLPMDNAVEDKLLPTEFTEMWMPVSKTRAALNRLREHYASGDISVTGPYPCEIYVTKGSRFWLSPAHARDVVKIDIFWFARNKGDPSKTFYPPFWRLLKEFEFRFHWGKYLSADSETGFEYLRALYPQWDAFMRLRAEFDPHQVFVTEYWRRHLGIAS